MISQVSSAIIGGVAGYLLAGKEMAKDLIEDMERPTGNYGSIAQISLKSSELKQGILNLSTNSAQTKENSIFASASTLGSISTVSTTDILNVLGLNFSWVFTSVKDGGSDENLLHQCESIVENTLTTNEFKTLLILMIVTQSDTLFYELYSDALKEFISAISALGDLTKVQILNAMALRQEKWMNVIKKGGFILAAYLRYLKQRRLDGQCGLKGVTTLEKYDFYQVAAANSNGVSVFDESEDGNFIYNSSQSPKYLKIKGAIRGRVYDREDSGDRLTSSLIFLPQDHPSQTPNCTYIDVASTFNKGSKEPKVVAKFHTTSFTPKVVSGYDAKFSNFIRALNYDIDRASKVKFCNDIGFASNVAVEDMPAADLRNTIKSYLGEPGELVCNLLLDNLKDPASDTYTASLRFYVTTEFPYLDPGYGIQVSDALYEDETVYLKKGQYLEIIPRSYNVEIIEIDKEQINSDLPKSLVFKSVLEAVQPYIEVLDNSTNVYPLPVGVTFYRHKGALRRGRMLLQSIIGYDGKGGDFSSDAMGDLKDIFSSNPSYLFNASELMRRLCQFHTYLDFPWGWNLLAYTVRVQAQPDAYTPEEKRFWQLLMSYQQLNQTIDEDSVREMATQFNKIPYLRSAMQQHFISFMDCKFLIPFRLRELLSYVTNKRGRSNKVDWFVNYMIVRELANYSLGDPNSKHYKLQMLTNVIINDLVSDLELPFVDQILGDVRANVNLYTVSHSNRFEYYEYFINYMESLEYKISDDMFRLVLKRMSNIEGSVR